MCVICHEEAEDPIASTCKHIFCRRDAELYLSSCNGTAQCPSCFRTLTIDLTQPAIAAKCALTCVSIICVRVSLCLCV